MKVDGRCHCGKISWEGEVDPARVSICHCTDCQQFSGSPYRAIAPAPAETFVIRGEPKLYVKTGESGNKRVQAFCGDCGTAIYSSAPENTPFYSLRLGSVRQRDQLPPKRQIWHRSAMPWADHIDELPANEKG